MGRKRWGRSYASPEKFPNELGADRERSWTYYGEGQEQAAAGDPEGAAVGEVHWAMHVKGEGSVTVERDQAWAGDGGEARVQVCGPEVHQSGLEVPAPGTGGGRTAGVRTAVGAIPGVGVS